MWGKVLHHLDAFTRDKKFNYHLFWFIVSGSLLCAALVTVMYPLWETILRGTTGLVYGQNPVVSYIAIVGPVEELTKFLVFILLTGLFKSIKEPRDGVIQAASVALGFALAENFYYGMDYGVSVLLVRSIVSILGHVTFAGFWGLGWGAFVYTSGQGRKTTDRYLVIPLILAAVVFHGMYDLLLEIGYFWLAITLDGISAVVFFSIYRFVKNNSPYRAFPLHEYRKAIPVLAMGLRRYPQSYVLNKRMGIFKIYARRYRDAQVNLEEAIKINPKGLEAKYYYGASLFLAGDTEKGTKIMNRIAGKLSKEERRKLNSRLKKIIHHREDRKEMYAHYDSVHGTFRKKSGQAGKAVSRSATSARLRYYRGPGTAPSASRWQRGYLPSKRKRVSGSELDEQVARYKELMARISKERR